MAYFSILFNMFIVFLFHVIKKNKIKYRIIGWYLICEQYKTI